MAKHLWSRNKNNATHTRYGRVVHTPELTHSEFRTLDDLCDGMLRVGSSAAQDNLSNLQNLERKSFVKKEVYMPESFGSSYVNYVLTEKGRKELEAHGGLREVTVKCYRCKRKQKIRQRDLGATDMPCGYCHAPQIWR